MRREAAEHSFRKKEAKKNEMTKTTVSNDKAKSAT